MAWRATGRPLGDQHRGTDGAPRLEVAVRQRDVLQRVALADLDAHRAPADRRRRARARRARARRDARCSGTASAASGTASRASRARAARSAAPGPRRCRSSPSGRAAAGCRARRRTCPCRPSRRRRGRPCPPVSARTRAGEVVAPEDQRVVAAVRARDRRPWRRCRPRRSPSRRGAGPTAPGSGPTPPAAACTTTVSPRATRCVRRSRNHAVRPFSIAAAASRSLTPSGIFTTRSAGIARSCA